MIAFEGRNTMWRMMLCLVIPALSFAQSGSLRGSLADGNGTPIADFPMAIALVPPSIPDGKYEPWTRTAFTNADGAFSLAAIPEGSYRICPQKAFPGHVNPCAWNERSVPIRITTGQAITLPAIRLAKARTLEIRLEDPGGFLAQARVPDRGGPVISSRNAVLLGVFTPAGHFVTGRFSNEGGHTKFYTIEVPVSGQFQFSAASTSLQLLDGAGQRIEASRGHSVAVESTDGKTLPPIVVRVQGLLSPPK